VWKALQKAANGNAAFKPGQAKPGALVNAEAEGKVSVVLACQVQLFGLGKLRRVPICSPNAQRQQGAFGQIHTAHLAGLERTPVSQLIGRFETKEFVDFSGQFHKIGLKPFIHERKQL
jgi:hypothetical protein